MNITTDTNVLVRATVYDDHEQASQAAVLLKQATLIAVPLPVLCEFVWVLSRGYKRSDSDIIKAIRQLMDCTNVEMNRPAVEAGLGVLAAGGDFADGVIAFDGRWLGGKVFTSFDKKAVSTLLSKNIPARLITP